MNDVYEFIKKLDINGKCVVAAISGGPDSMFLLDTLIKLRYELDLKIVCAHVHHNLRKESDEEAIQVEKFCKENSIIFEMMKIDKYPENKFSEESARKIRYDFFDKIVNKYNADTLFTAHHGDDLIETVLMRITRGSNLKGYAGFERLSMPKGYKIAKPLIFITKDQIVTYLDELGIWYAIDKSNSDNNYTRNRYRNYILPRLKEEDKNVHKKFNKYNEKILLASNYIEKETDKYYSRMVTDNKIDVCRYLKLDKIIQISIIEKYLHNIYNNDINLVNDKHVELIMDLMNSKTNTRLTLPLNKIARLEYNKFVIVDNKTIKDYEYMFDDNIVFENNKCIEINKSTELTNNYVIHLDSKEIVFPLHVRNRRNGDYMIVKNMLGKKKISDILIDEKIPTELRDIIPIVTDDTGEIIWIPGIKKSHFDKRKEKKYDIILKYYQKEENNE